MSEHTFYGTGKNGAGEYRASWNANQPIQISQHFGDYKDRVWIVIKQEDLIEIYNLMMEDRIEPNEPLSRDLPSFRNEKVKGYKR